MAHFHVVRLVASFACFGFATTASIRSLRNETSVADRLCISSDCFDASDYLKSRMRPEVNPCDNFYEFVCGKQDDQNPLPKNLPRAQEDWRNFLRNVHGNISHLLTEAQPEEPWLKKAQIMYGGCIDSASYVNNDYGYITRLLKQIYSLKNWDQILGSLKRHLSLSAMMDVHYSLSAKGSIAIDQDKYLLINSEIYRYKALIPEIFESKLSNVRYRIKNLVNKTESIFTDLNIQFDENSLEDLLKFESKFAHITAPPTISRNQWSERIEMHRYSYSELRLLYFSYGSKNWDWGRFFKPWQNSLKLTLSDFTVTNPSYLLNVIDVLHTVQRKTVLQYLTVRLLFMLNTEFIDMSHQPMGLLARQERNMPFGSFLATENYVYSAAHSNRSDVIDPCVAKMAYLFPGLYLTVLDQQFIPASVKGRVSDLSWNIRREMSASIEKNSWLAANKKLIENKLDSLNILLAYPQAQVRPDRANALYANLHISKDDSYSENILKFLSFSGTIILTRFYPDFFLVEFPFYVPLLNTVAIQPAFIQRPQFDPNWPAFTHYGSLGSAIGHELAHAVTGFHFAANGSHLPTLAWPTQFTRLWLEKKNCFRRHYSQYELAKGIHVNSDLTMAENMADVLGLQLSFRAFIRSAGLQGQKADPLLPSFSRYTAEQMFFVSLGRSVAYCQQSSNETVVEYALSDTHTPGSSRLIGMLRNSQEFAQAFNCPIGSFMNPRERKCSLLNH